MAAGPAGGDLPRRAELDPHPHGADDHPRPLPNLPALEKLQDLPAGTPEGARYVRVTVDRCDVDGSAVYLCEE